MAWIIIGFTLVLLIDIKPLLHSENKSGMVTFLVIFLIALSLAVLQFFKVEIPSIMMFLGDIVKALGLDYPA